MKCEDCRKKEIDPTFSDRIALFFIKKLFPETLSDIKGDSFTQGFTEGYQEGFKRSEELSRLQIQLFLNEKEGPKPRKNKKRAS